MKTKAQSLKWALEIAEASRFIRLHDYRPYPKQAEFHAQGATRRERLLMAGNQNGKTYAGAAETAMHATGQYPESWEGLRLSSPLLVWVAGITNQQTRDTAQRALFGPINDLGTGMIPADCIEGYTLAKGITDFMDTVRVRHESGRPTQLQFKSYEQGRQKWQGPGVHFLWCDEEPPQELYTEGLARTTATGGSAIITFTPLLGMTEVVSWFYPEPNEPHRALVQMTIEDALHIPAERRAAEIAKYPLHEREARVRGVPMLGSGRVFPVEEAAIVVEPREIPAYWPRVAGVDFGWDHPNATAWCAWDRDTDTFYVYAEHREREQVLALHADAIRARGAWIPCAWPHDGMVHDKQSGTHLAVQYAQKGVRMLPELATFPDGSTGLEAGIAEMLDRMKTGRWKVFATCTGWLEEFRMYHRKEGKIVKLRDDLLSASRYALMMRRYARTEEPRRVLNTRNSGYDPLEALH